MRRWDFRVVAYNDGGAMVELNLACDEIRRLPTPTLLLNGPVVRQNIARLAGYATTVGLKVRPHAKTHKSRRLAQMQLDAGAIGITTAKVSEAEEISAADEDVLVAYPPVGDVRAARMAALARDRVVRAAVDSLTAVEQASAAAQAAKSTIGLLVDIDVGLHRTGVESPAATLPLAQAIDQAPGVRLDGIMVYPGHISEPVEEQAVGLKKVGDLIAETIALWARHGLAAAIVSGGSTPTAYQSHVVGNLTEIRPGTYIFNDMNTLRGGYCSLADCAARVLVTVVSNAIADQIVLDAGSKTLTSDRCILPEHGFGHIVELPAARITKLNEEHAQVDVSACNAIPAVGERLTVIPNHICPCVNLCDTMWWVEPNEPPRPLGVDARGKVQ
jgi:D-serine deaminase-like pyridoxal phosphate-dependent protein